MTEKTRKKCLFNLFNFITYLQDRYIFSGIIVFLISKNVCIDTKPVTPTALELVMAQNVISKFQWRPF